ncbi:MAG: zinc-binding dehydrogenase [Halobacteria archaeon]
MRAVTLRGHGGPEVLKVETLPDPRPGPKEALVRVKACGLNHLDVWVRKGLPNLELAHPHIPGADISGTVVEAGPGAGREWVGRDVVLQPGLSCGACPACASGRDDMCPRYGILGEHRPGGCAELVAVPRENLMPKPARISHAEAACIPVVFLTAWHMLVARAQVRPGESVVVMAAGSGVGSAAVQIAKLWGATVIAAAGSAGKLDRARKLGADHGIDYGTEDLGARIKELTGGRGADVIADSVGVAQWERMVRALAWGGRLVTCGATSGFDARTDLRHLFFRRLSLLGSTMGSKGELHDVMRHVEAGKLKPVLDTVFPLEKVAEAHKRLEGREVFGKLVLEL